MRNLLRLTQPIKLVLVSLSYIFGVGVARYLGVMPDAPETLSGWGFVVLILAAANLLVEYFRPFNEPIIAEETRAERETLRTRLLFFSASLLLLAAFLVLVLFFVASPQLSAIVFIALYAMLALALSVPPLRLVDRGLGELASALMIASFTPAIAFTLQHGELHRLLTYLTFPLTFVALAYFIVLDFPFFADDEKYERRTLLTGLTWQRAIPVHNILLVVAYLMLAAASFFGIPFALVWPPMLTLPIAIYEIFQMRNIADGAPPSWTILVTTATALFGIMLYLLAFTFWMR